MYKDRVKQILKFNLLFLVSKEIQRGKIQYINFPVQFDDEFFRSQDKIFKKSEDFKKFFVVLYPLFLEHPAILMYIA